MAGNDIRSGSGARRGRGGALRGVAGGLLLGLVQIPAAAAPPGGGEDPGPAAPAADARSLTVEEAIRIAREKNPSLEVARAERERAEAATRTAAQYRNPSLDGGGGSLRGREAGVSEGAVWRVSLAQPLESPFVRSARRDAADAAFEAADAATRARDAAIVARVKRAFAETRLAAGLHDLAAEQLALLDRVRAGIARQVEVGEGPGVDLARAETEVLKARRDVAEARMRRIEARQALATAIGEPEAGEVRAEGELPPFALPPRDDLKARLAAANPRLEEARMQVTRAESQVRLQRARRLDGFDVHADWEREPDNEIFAVGLRVPLPVWNRRQGEIAEARARLKRARAELRVLEHGLARELDALYNRYRVARERITLIDEGMLREARRALAAAEAAYRSGERGILEYLDSQRTLRDVQLDLLSARGELQRAAIEIERLAGEAR